MFLRQSRFMSNLRQLFSRDLHAATRLPLVFVLPEEMRTSSFGVDGHTSLWHEQLPRPGVTEIRSGKLAGKEPRLSIIGRRTLEGMANYRSVGFCRVSHKRARHFFRNWLQ
jgi:hypothetical protein